MIDFLRNHVPLSLRMLLYDLFLVARGSLLSLTTESHRIRALQRKYLEENYIKDAKKLVIFLTPGSDIVNGGVLSISSLFEETKKIMNKNGVETVLCSYPGDSPIYRYTKFNNQNTILNLSDVLTYFNNLDYLLLHIPERFISRFLWTLPRQVHVQLSEIPDVSINILIQNIEFLPKYKTINKLKTLGKLTATTAHTKYSTLKLRNDLGFPLHKLSTYLSPDKYYYKPYAEKENIMIVSPDAHSRRAEVIKTINNNLTQLQIKVIQNLTYEQYKQLISEAKWALTFGEGLDGYFLEPIFSGSISFSVYNSAFFTEDFKALRTVYENYDVLIQKICLDIKELDNQKEYSNYQKEQFAVGQKNYKYKEYLQNLESFYKGDYTFK